MTPDALPLTSPEATLGGIVTAHPRAAALFEQLGLDYCCGGGQTLTDACREHELDATEIEAALEQLDAEQGAGHEHDVSALTITALSEHIVSAHHEPAREQLERIAELLVKVTRAHGDQDPSVHLLQQQFTALRSELAEHMELEEQQLFPACRSLEAGKSEPDQELLALLRDTHTATGAALAELRQTGNDYEPASAHCTTHRVLLSELTALELDLHQHIHEENNILFPQVQRLLPEAA